MKVIAFIALYSSTLLALLTPYCGLSAKTKVIAVSDYHLKLVIQEVAPTAEVIFPFQANGDPHHFEPNLNSIKSFLNADYKVLNRTDDGWKKGIEAKLRDRKDALILDPIIPLQKSDLNKFSPHALAHFWLNPIIGCHYFERIKKYLSEIQYPTKKKSSCPYTVRKPFQQIIKRFPWHQIILTHDASLGLFSELPIEKILVLKGSEHANQVGLLQLKKLYQLTAKDQTRPLLWLLESQLYLPARIETRIRKFDHVIKINTLGKDLKSSGVIIQEIQKQIFKLQQGLKNAQN